MHSLLKLATLLTVSAGGFLALAPAVSTPADAVVCARGVRGAACAGPRGAAAVRRPAPVVVAPVRRGAVVAPVRRGAVVVR